MADLPAPARADTGLSMRQVSAASTFSDDAIPEDDPTTTTGLLDQRLRAWKHAVAYLEDYVSATEKLEKAHAKEYEKVLKTIASPLREGEHFDQQHGGMATLFESMRADTQGLINSHLETEKNLKATILPVLDRLHKEIKNKAKELQSGAGKTAKEVEKARNNTQKYIEMLGSHTGVFQSVGGQVNASEDPYVIKRGIYHRLHKQLLEENGARQDLISVQNNFATFEAHIVEVIQQAMGSFNELVSGQAQKDMALFSDITANAQSMPPEFEWKGFNKRFKDRLIDPDAAPRRIDDVTFPNQDHASTKPLIEGTLERKSRNKLSLQGFTAGHYVVTPSMYLHEFKESDNTRRDPVPELSIFLPDATIGALNGDKFNIKGKDVSRGIGGKLSGSPEIQFKAGSASDAEMWWKIISDATARSGNDLKSPVSPISPAGSEEVGVQRSASIAKELPPKSSPEPAVADETLKADEE